MTRSPSTRSPAPPAYRPRASRTAAGLRFRRLRLRIGGNELAPSWLIDGISLFLKIGSLELSGSGTITDSTRDGHRYQEFGLGLQLRFQAMGKDFAIGAQLFYGRVEGPVDRFTYWLFGLQLANCPAGAYELRGVSALVAGGMMPNLPEPSGKPQEMRLLDWYRQNRATGAVEIRDDRAPQRGGWRVEQGAEAAGVGADLGLSATKAVTLRVFMFFHRSDAASGLLISGEVFVLKAKKPVGFGAIEADLDRDRYSAIVGVDLDLAALLDSDSRAGQGAGSADRHALRGQPARHGRDRPARRPGQLAHALLRQVLPGHVGADVDRLLPADLGAPGPARVRAAWPPRRRKGSLGIGKVQFYAAFGVLVGTWGNEASSSGVVAWAEVALRIKVFWVFSFGAAVKAVIEQLGPQEPNYRRIGLEVRIETPWWLPDVTFRVEKVARPPAARGDAGDLGSGLRRHVREPGLTTETVVIATALGDAGAPCTPWRSCVRCPLGQLAEDRLGLAALRSASTPCSPSTSAPRWGTRPRSRRACRSMPACRPRPRRRRTSCTASYTLIEVAVRRRPRYGDGAGVWTDLLAPEDSQVGDLGDLENDPDLGVTFASVLKFRWDADVIVDDAITPGRLLVNADTPYSFVTSAPAVDEGVLAGDPMYPCCGGKRTYPSHVLDFTAVPLGVRAAEIQRFTNSTSTLRWQLPRPPVVAASQGPQAGAHVARVAPHSAHRPGAGRGHLRRAGFAVSTCRCSGPPSTSQSSTARWWSRRTRGLEVVDRKVLRLDQASPSVPVHLQGLDAA